MKKLIIFLIFFCIAPVTVSAENWSDEKLKAEIAAEIKLLEQDQKNLEEISVRVEKFSQEIDQLKQRIKENNQLIKNLDQELELLVGDRQQPPNQSWSNGLE